ncbi:hypothetical protein KC19_8G124700 [Ceratodon purpureus]|uniref:FAS1 domain-containing protein n=1 Tax=Ceratodon purpureus TaxID=3225 RepID=A0A8T0H2N8_CERPU|nr:hypothetical protein KC19_8G124700 [Ceratodon purpureus]
MTSSVAILIRSCALKTALMVAMALFVMPHFNHAQTQCNTTLLEAVRATPELELLAAVIEASGLSNQLNSTDNVTVLAPDNTAFNGTDGLLGMLAANNLTLEQVTSSGNNRAASIVLYHIIPSSATAAELTNGQSLPTALGTGYSLTVHKTTGPLIISFVGKGSNATVIAADIRVCNSVVHVLNRVLLPAPTLTAIPVYNDTPAAPGISPSTGGGNGDGDVGDDGNPTVPTVTPPPSAATFNSLDTKSLMLGLSGVITAALMM